MPDLTPITRLSRDLRTAAKTMSGSTTVAPDGTLQVYTATAGSISASAAADDLVVENSDDGGITILVPDASFSYLIFGSPGDESGALLRHKQSTATFEIGTATAGHQLIFASGDVIERARIDSVGAFFIGTPADFVGSVVNNADMTKGLTINQGTSDDQILALKSSDVAHGVTNETETDTYGFMKKQSLTAGGLLIQGVAENGSTIGNAAGPGSSKPDEQAGRLSRAASCR